MLPTLSPSKMSLLLWSSLLQQCNTKSHVLRLLLFLQLLLLSFVGENVFANPVSSPEIINKSSKTATTSLQQQPLQQKSNPQDAHLNSLTVYATNYDSITSASPHKNFKPSYKVPEMETNFTPIQNAPVLGDESATPVLMQYLPQPMHEGGIHYLQLIPTRPLIVPISPYMAGTADTPHQLHSLAVSSPIAEYAERPATMLTAIPANTAVHAAAPHSTLIDTNNNFPYNLQTYTNSIQPYRNNFRINREIKEKQIPGPINLNLNMNEYIPDSKDASQTPIFVRGRP